MHDHMLAYYDHLQWWMAMNSYRLPYIERQMWTAELMLVYERIQEARMQATA